MKNRSKQWLLYFEIRSDFDLKLQPDHVDKTEIRRKKLLTYKMNEERKDKDE